MKLSQNPMKLKTASVSLLKDSDFEIKTQSEIRQNRRKGQFSTAFAARTSELLKNCPSILKAQVYNNGDNVEAFFKKSLRNWDQSSYTAKTPRWLTLPKTKSSDSLISGRRTTRSVRTSVSISRASTFCSTKAGGDKKLVDKPQVDKLRRAKSFGQFKGSLPELNVKNSNFIKENQEILVKELPEAPFFKQQNQQEEELPFEDSNLNWCEEVVKVEKGEDFQEEDLDLFFSPTSEVELEQETNKEGEIEDEVVGEETNDNKEETNTVLKEEEEESVKSFSDVSEDNSEFEEKNDFVEKELELSSKDQIWSFEEKEEQQEYLDEELPTAENNSTMAEDESVEEIGLEDTVTEELHTETIADDDLQEIENLVKQADQELDQVMDENPDLKEAMDMEETCKMLAESMCQQRKEIDSMPVRVDGPCGGEGGGSFFKYNPNVDSNVLAELEDAEKQAMETAKIICELKKRVGELLCKSKMTDAEGKELEEKNQLLKEQMMLFEEKTKRIQQLITETNLFDSMAPMTSGGQQGHQQKRPEDMLPKVVICGLTENNMPKIIVCDDKDKRRKQKQTCGNIPPCPPGPQYAKRLSESYTMQEKLAAENAQLEGTRYQLQEDLLSRDQFVENLQRKLCSLEQELRLVCKENSALNDKIKGQGGAGISDQKVASVCGSSKKMPCGKGKGPCPAEMENRLMEYVETTHNLERQLNDMESEVRHMQCELVEVQKERQHLEHHRRMICTPPCRPCPAPCPPPCGPQSRPPCGTIEQQLSQLKEQYCRLQDDFKSKLTEVASLRAENEKLKMSSVGGDDPKKSYEQRIKDLEREVRMLKMELEKAETLKQQMIELEAQLNVAKQRFRDAQDELEELRALIQDQQTQMDDYRNKYLQAQQTVEEQRRQIDLMEIENNRISEQVNLEIQRVKNQFQEKLQELTPLPDILKATQIKLQEAQQMHLLAERNNEAIARELQQYKDRAAAMAADMEKVRSDQQLGADEHAVLESKIRELTSKCQELDEENDKLKMDLIRLEEAYDQAEKRVQEKLHEITQLVAQLDSVREESARQVARTKDRCETVRRSMQNQIADLERQLAQSRAQARQAQKDRDEIRQKMQAQITNLNENFEDAQMRIKNLQAHVNFLKNTYSSVYPDSGTTPMMGDGGVDACDCGQY